MTFKRLACMGSLIAMTLSFNAADADAQGRQNAPCTPELLAQGMQCQKQLQLDLGAPAQQQGEKKQAPMVSHSDNEPSGMAHGQGAASSAPTGYALHDPSGAYVDDLDYVSSGQGFEEFRLRQGGGSLFIDTAGQGGGAPAFLGFAQADGEACPNGPLSGPTGVQYPFWAAAEIRQNPNGDDISIAVMWCGTSPAEVLTGAAVWG